MAATKHRYHCKVCGELSADTWTSQRGAANAWLAHAAEHAIDGLGMELLSVAAGTGGATVKPKPERARPALRERLAENGAGK